MSIGNLKDSGNQGNNFPWQLKMLQGLQAIHDEVSQPLTCAEDSVSICAGGNLLTSTTIGADKGLDVNIIGSVTLEVNLDATNDQVGIYGYINGASNAPVPLNVNATGQVAIQDGGNSITIDATSLPLPTGAATEATLVAVNTKLASATRTPNILTNVGVGSTPAGIYSFSIANVGNAAGLVNGQSVPAGVTINFDAGSLNNTLNSLPYDASGTTFIITWIS